MCVMDGILTHSSGHSVPVHQEVAVPEEIISGTGKSVANSAQRCGMAESYCVRRGTCNVFGIITGDDSDGSTAAPSLTAAQIAELTSAGKAANFDDARIIKMLAVAARDGFEKTMRAVKTAAGVKS
jgi:hypothetical protein